MIIQGATIRGGNYIGLGALYDFNIFQFTNGPSTGNTGPTLGQLYSSYSNVGNTWLQSTDYFNVSTRGIQLWTVPQTASYNITVVGASGGNNTAGVTGNIGGRGARLTTTVTLTQGQQLAIVVGQRGLDRSNANSNGFTLNGASGGGGTFVYDASTFTYYAVAGGGGGAGIVTNNFSGNVQDARYDSVWGGNVVIGSGFYANGGGVGLGGNVSSRAILYGGPGAGVLGYGLYTGVSANVVGMSGQGRTGNWLGGNAGIKLTANALVGGFGGGGSAGVGDNNYTSGYFAGGGGGYSGGGAGGNSGDSNASNGGGGGSYYAGILVNGTNAANFGNGYVIIAKV